jgi:TonB-linked SusC/RagA family outer membrane protein
MRSKFKWIFTLLLAFTMQFSFAQEKTVTGVVSDEKGPIPGANIVVKGATSRSTQTDVDGKYSIKAKQGEVLLVSFIGYNDSSITVGAANNYNVKLSGESVQLNEIVVTTALGIQKRKSAITYSSDQIGTKELTQAGAPSAIQGLIGKVSGLQINTTSNGVNQGSRIVINGPRSISGNNQALIVIDNAISNATIFGSLPPEIIETVNVIKGAQGAALYGSDGVNGVIIVTTKRGTTGGKMSVSVSSSIDFQEVNYLPERQTRYGQGWFGEQIAIENGSWGAQLDGSLQPVGLPQPDGSFKVRPYSVIEDNIGQFFQKGTIQQKSISVSGGTLAEGYAALTIGRQDREFVVKGDELYRTNFSFKAGKSVGKWFVEGDVQYYNQKQQNTTAGLYAELLQTAVNIPVGEFDGSGNNHHWTVYYRSPSWTRDNVRGTTGTDFMSGSTTLQYKFNDHISAKWVANVRLNSTSFESHTNAFTAADDVYNAFSNRIVISNMTSSTSTSRIIYSDFLVDFDYDLSKDISFSATVGNNIQDAYGRTNQVGGSELDVDGWYNFNNVLEPSLASGLNNTSSRSRRFSYFASADFGYKKYLTLNITGRNDYTSTLSSANRSFFYPSAGLSFVPTKAFAGMKSDTFNFAKLTLGWTKVGNTSSVGAYQIDDIGVVPTGFPFGDLASYIGNQNPTSVTIKPEFVTTVDFGLTLGFLKDRLTFDAQFFNQTTTDLITAATASSASGLNSFTGNIGELETKGYNLDLGFKPFDGKFKWEGKINLSHYKTIVNSVAAGVDEVNLATSAVQSVGIFAVVGEEFPLIKGVGYIRDDAGNVVIDAATGNPLRTSEFIKLGKSTPDYILGFSNSFSYKGFKLTAVCDYRTGHQFLSEVKDQLAWTGNLIESAENGRSGGFIFPNSVYESAPGVYTQNTNIVTGGNSYTSYQTYFSDEFRAAGENFVIDATAFKVRELALNYTLPKTYIEKTGLSELSFGVNARNPFMVLPNENRNYQDPETAGNAGPNGNGAGIATIGQYPNTRTFGFTINAKF